MFDHYSLGGLGVKSGSSYNYRSDRVVIYRVVQLMNYE